MTQIDKYTILLLDKKNWKTPNSFEEFGYIYFGPLLFNFFIWLKSELDDCDKILFNSREGFFLQRIYKLFQEKYNLPESVYFKTSRKLSSLASFSNSSDIYESFKLHAYNGNLKNLLKDRFGIITDVKNDINVNSKQEIPNLEKYMNDIFNHSKNIKHQYQEYIYNVIGDSKNIIMVDSGYQGTTQSNIQKAYGLKFKGRYFTYTDNKELNDVKGFLNFEDSYFRRNLIFFESIFIDSIGSYTDIQDGKFVNEIIDLELNHFDKKEKIINGIEQFINDMFEFDIHSNDVSYKFPDYIFNLMCMPHHIKNNELFDIFYHDNLYARNTIKKIHR